jgi:hypothetical protein
MATINLFTRYTEKQPVFDFMIKKEDFYINTHGVSVTELDKSATIINDGLFYILNKNNKPLYFNGLFLSNVRMRRERGYPGNALRVRLADTSVSGNFLFERYNVIFRGRLVGELTIRRLSTYQNNNNSLINPFQSIEFSATYRVINLNNLNEQYYGKSRLNQNKKKGTIDINFTVKCFTDKELTQDVVETLTITINTVNTGFVPTALQQQPTYS